MRIPILIVAILLSAAAGWFLASPEIPAQAPGKGPSRQGKPLGSAIPQRGARDEFIPLLKLLQSQLDESLTEPDGLLLALRLIDALGDYPLEEFAYWWLAGTVGETDPQQVFEQLLSMGFEHHPEFADRFLAEWYRRDPGAAWAALEARTASSFTDASGTVPAIPLDLIIAQFSRDPQSVYDLVRMKTSDRGPLWAAIANEIAKTDLPAAIAALEKMTGDKGEAIDVIASRWARSDPAAAVEWSVRTNDDYFGFEPSHGAFIEWFKQDRDAALAAEETYSIATPSGAPPFRDDLLHSWLLEQPDKALPWLLDSDEKASRYLRYMWSLGHQNAPEHLAIAREISAQAELRLAPHLADGWAMGGDFEAAIAWARQLPASPETALARMKILDGLGNAGDEHHRQRGRELFDEFWNPDVNITRFSVGYHLFLYPADGVLRLLGDEPDTIWERISETGGENDHQKLAASAARLLARSNLGAAVEILERSGAPAEEIEQFKQSAADRN